MPKPKHEHDCEYCVFVGASPNGGDVYVHPGDVSEGGNGLLVRYGPDGDYLSYRAKWVREATDVPEVAAALAIAEGAGFQF